MNRFLSATKQAIIRHGQLCVYTRVSTGVYDVATGGSTATTTTYNITAYKKHIKANQFNFPNLIGKETALFYIASDSLTFEPKPKDKISSGSKTYTIDSVQSHVALGQVVLYRVMAVI